MIQRFIRGWRLYLLVSLVLALSVIPVQAHALLAKSDPPANASLSSAPTEIRLWFTEPVEPDYSSFSLRDSSGNPVKTPHSQVDPSDPTQMFMQPGTLPNGLYTVTWRTVSAADGHSIDGSFAFGIGVAVANNPVPTIDESVLPAGVVIRWLNLISLSLAVGVIGFWLFVAQPAALNSHDSVRRRWRQLLWIGWGLVGLSALLLLLLQVSTDANTAFFAALASPALADVITHTEFGQLWLARVGVWALLGIMLWLARRSRRALWLALIVGGVLLAVQSLFSHASAAPDRAAVANDWLHLLSSSLWIGGLAAFVLALLTLRREPETTPLVARLVAAFSNFARVAVVLLVVTGLYAAWLEVGAPNMGGIDALLHTVYGNALIVKGILFLPLLAIAAVNLLLTQRGLDRGQAVWTGRLRGLVGTEIALTVGILLAVGVMTSGSPGRGVQALRDLAAAPPQTQPYFDMEIVNNQMMHLQIVPGTVGMNRFIVTPFDPNQQPITDATSVRLIFTNLDEDLGQSELDPKPTGNGDYTVSGANLSTPGHWRIRMIMAQPGKFDTIADFNADMQPPPPAPTYDEATAIPAAARTLAALLIGLALLAIGGFFTLQSRRRLISGSGLLALAGVVVGLIFLLTAARSVSGSGTLTVSDAWARPMDQGFTDAVYLTINNDTGSDETLVAAASGIADSVDLHQTVIQNNIARMLSVDKLDIPAGSTLQIAPEGYHLMLNNLHQDLSDGATFPVTLKFASGQQITVMVHVEDNAATAARP